LGGFGGTLGGIYGALCKKGGYNLEDKEVFAGDEILSTKSFLPQITGLKGPREKQHGACKNFTKRWAKKVWVTEHREYS